jgi:hypothetical protein
MSTDLEELAAPLRRLRQQLDDTERQLGVLRIKLREADDHEVAQRKKLTAAEERAAELLEAVRAAAPAGHLFTHRQAVEWLRQAGPALDQAVKWLREESYGDWPGPVLHGLGFDID